MDRHKNECDGKYSLMVNILEKNINIMTDGRKLEDIERWHIAQA